MLLLLLWLSITCGALPKVDYHWRMVSASLLPSYLPLAPPAWSSPTCSWSSCHACSCMCTPDHHQLPRLKIFVSIPLSSSWLLSSWSTSTLALAPPACQAPCGFPCSSGLVMSTNPCQCLIASLMPLLQHCSNFFISLHCLHVPTPKSTWTSNVINFSLLCKSGCSKYVPPPPHGLQLVGPTMGSVFMADDRAAFSQ